MKFTIIGSGAWEGIPAPFCSCDVCSLAIKEPRSKNNRTRPQFLIEGTGGNFLLETSPDIRIQSTAFNATPITDFFVSHWHFDHMYGLHELLSWMKRLSQKPTIHCSTGTKEVIEKEFGYLPLKVNVLEPLKPFTIFGVVITPLPMYHMFNRDNEVPEELLRNSYAYLLESAGVKVAYLGDYYRVPQATLQKIQNADAIIADGTYLLTEKYKDSKPNHMHGEDILRFTSGLGAKTVYYHSISHLTCKTHEEFQKAMPTSHVIPYDGMEVSFLK